MVFTKAYKEQALALITGDSGTHLNSSNTYLALGDGTDAANETDTALGNELGRYLIDSVTRTGVQVTYNEIINSTQLNGQDLKEMGLFDASTSGNMVSRVNIATISKTSAVELEVVYTIQVI